MALFKSFGNILDEKPPEKEFIKPEFTNIDFDIEAISNRLIKIRNSVEDEKSICDLIYNSFNIIFDDVYLRNDKNRDEIISVFGNELFLKCLINILPEVKMTNSQIICCNKIAWDYLSSQAVDDNKYRTISNLLFQLSYNTNKPLINILSTHMPVEMAKYVALARHSSFNEYKNIKRVNAVLMKSRINVQDIVNIYSVLFVQSITPVFESIMNNFDSNLVGVEKETDGNIVLAILIILENMPSVHIKAVLRSYTVNYNLLNKKVRFPIRTISSGDYKRILNIVDALEMEDIYVP